MATGDSIAVDPPQGQVETVFTPEAMAEFITKAGAAVEELAKRGVQCRTVTLNPSDGTVHFSFEFGNNFMP